MTPDERNYLAAIVLQRGKTLAPDRFPGISAEVTEAWGRVLGSLNVPVEMWPEAVDLWATESVGDRMATPRDLLQAVRDVRDRWERDPSRRELLAAHRRALRDARDAALERGELKQVRTMPELRQATWPGAGSSLPASGGGD